MNKSIFKYQWKRFWYLRNATPYVEDGGYLYDPDSEYSAFYSLNVKTFQEISGCPCLILLAEPGMGKTKSMEAEKEIIDTDLKEKNIETLWLDLRICGSEDRLYKLLFENPAYLRWKEGDHHLHIFLDSFDEALLRIDTLAAILSHELQQCPVERLFLRISSRTANWPKELEDSFKRIWQDEQVKVYQLAPLRRKDITHAAIVNALNADEFLKAIDIARAVAFAVKPVTLEFLLNLFKRYSTLPSNQFDLYNDGCLLLCEEQKEVIKGKKQTSATVLIKIAQRLGAIIILANKYSIWTGIDRGDVPTESVTISNLLRGNSESDGAWFNEAFIRETLDTGLFSSAGENQLRFAHQTYAEFLAAAFLIHNNIKVVQILSLLQNEDRRINPQLYELTAILTSNCPDLIPHIIDTDPYSIVRANIVDDETRERLVKALLLEFDNGNLLDRDRSYYPNLNHGNLTNQLRPYIIDSKTGVIARRVAIHIAEACNLTELSYDLLQLALNENDRLETRVSAAYALHDLTDEDTKAKLRPLLIPTDKDENLELFGVALKSLWPQHLSVQEVLQSLLPPRSVELIGAFETFVAYDFSNSLKIADISYALEWLASLPYEHLPNGYEALSDRIIIKGWKNILLAEVQRPLARAILSICKKHHSIISNHFSHAKKSINFNYDLETNDQKRRILLEAIAQELPSVPKELHLSLRYPNQIVISKDLPWLLEKLDLSQDEREIEGYSILIAALFNLHNSELTPQYNGNVLDACFKHPTLKALCMHFIEEIDLKSESADFFRRHNPWEPRSAKQPDKKKKLKPGVKTRIVKCLDEIESGKPDSWWHLHLILPLEDDGTQNESEWKKDIRMHPGWQNSPRSLQQRIISGAKEYLINVEPNNDKLLHTGTISSPEAAGYMALLLLYNEEPEYIGDLNIEVWNKWLPILFKYPLHTGEETASFYEIIAKVYSIQPNEVLHILNIFIDKANEDAAIDTLFILDRLDQCWDDRLSEYLFRKLTMSHLTPNKKGSVISHLLKHEYLNVKDYVYEVLKKLVYGVQNIEEGIEATKAILKSSNKIEWDIIWPLIQVNEKFADAVIETMAHENRRELFHNFSENQLFDLYIWLENKYPSSEYHRPRGGYMVSTRDMIEDWKNTIIRYLEGKGSNQSVLVLEKLLHEQPHLSWLRWTLVNAREITRRKNWRYPTPTQIIQLALNSKARFVESAGQLSNVVIESLQRLQENLQGETPSAIDLWNQMPNNIYSPKDENTLSDYIKRHLDRDLKEQGIVINREVEIRKGKGGSHGERTDIHIDAVSINFKGERDIITLILEVKGCWNPNLLTDMEAQLVDRYLKDNVCKTGIYLVGWFLCDQWNSKESNEKKRRRLAVKNESDIVLLKGKLTDQSVLLSQKNEQLSIHAITMDCTLR